MCTQSREVLECAVHVRGKAMKPDAAWCGEREREGSLAMAAKGTDAFAFAHVQLTAFSSQGDTELSSTAGASGKCMLATQHESATRIRDWETARTTTRTKGTKVTMAPTEEEEGVRDEFERLSLHRSGRMTARTAPTHGERGALRAGCLRFSCRAES